MVAVRGGWVSAVVASLVLVPVLAGGSAAQARGEAVEGGPVLERVAPVGAVEVEDDKACFTLTVRGRGFVPDVVSKAGDGATLHSQEVRLAVGTDQAMGVLSGAPVSVYPDADGAFEKTFRPCGVTTHGSTESDFTCTAKDAEHERCEEWEVGDVKQSGGRWVSRLVQVVATHEPCLAVEKADRRACLKKHGTKDNFTGTQTLGRVTWPLKVTGKQ
ncbi:hypothetical protein ACFYUL_10890 [Streptomyces sp. NPDC004311]|uniref:hypothetical protein n=1 Tax=Streptomyces sp. NPDC004311 TaxID=3364698 RepID=UPI00369D7131